VNFEVALLFLKARKCIAFIFCADLEVVQVVKSRRMRWAGHVARMGEDRGVHRVLVGKPE
jgi:hypothetical protein